MHADQKRVAPFLALRSQSVDAARELVGWTHQINLADIPCNYGTFAITPQYTQSTNPKALGRCLFGSSLSEDSDITSVKISGSRVLNRGSNDWLADYFYLPTDYQSTLEICPSIKNIMADFNLYIGFDAFLKGLYLRIHAPLAHTTWDLHFREYIENKGIASDDPGYFAPAAIPRSNLLASFSDFACGKIVENVPDAFFNQLRYAKITCHKRSATSVSDLQAVIGYNVLLTKNYHLGVGMRAAAPTGNRPMAHELFEPIVGNGRHWELGAQITSHVTLYGNDETNAGFYCDANITHMFKAWQRRTFDLRNKPLSRYMPAVRLGTPVEFGLVGVSQTPIFTAIPAIAQFQQIFAPIANLTTQDVRVKIKIQADVVLLFNVTHRGFSGDIGYNFWAHSCEKISRDWPPVCPKVNDFAFNSWGLKGDEQVWGYSMGTAGVMATPLSATQCKATINSGTNYPAQGTQDPTVILAGQKNPGIDNPLPAYIDAGATQLSATPQPFNFPINTSIEPVFLLECNFVQPCFGDKDLKGTRGLSHKVFAHVSYDWPRECAYAAYIGLGGYAEFGQSSKNKSNTSSQICCQKNSCLQCSLSQWSIWLKGGITF